MIRTISKGLLPHVWRKPSYRHTAVRHYSVGEKLKDANELLKKIGDEKSKESEVTLKYMRRIGVISVAVVLGSIAWASTFTEPEEVIVEEMKDLSKDVRDIAR